MFHLDSAFLADLNLDGLPVEEANLFLKHVYETLELRVGGRLAGAMRGSQLDEFHALFESNEEEAALDWLGRELPNYRDVVEEEFELLRAELREMAPTIMSLSGQAG